MFGTLVMWLVLAGATLVIVSVVLEGLFAVHDAIAVSWGSLGLPAAAASRPAHVGSGRGRTGPACVGTGATDRCHERCAAVAGGMKDADGVDSLLSIVQMPVGGASRNASHH